MSRPIYQMNETQDTLKTHREIKLVATGVAICFFVTSIFTPDLFAQSSAQPSSNILQVESLSLNNINIPKKFGEVISTFQHNGSATVVLIEDAHAIPDAQRSISQLIKFLTDKVGVRLVATEGASGKLDATFLKSFPDRKKLEKALSHYHEIGELTGVNASLLTTQDEVQFFGIENEALYEEGLVLFQKSYQAQVEQEDIFRFQEEKLNGLKRVHYSDGLLRADQVIRAFHKNDLDLIQLLEQLSVFQAPHPESELFHILSSIHEHDSEELRREALQLYDELKKISKKEMGEKSHHFLNEKYQAFQTDVIGLCEFVMHLKSKVDDMDDEVFQISDELNELANRGQRIRNIKGTKLHDDLDAYINNVLNSLIQTSLEKEINQQSEEFELLTKLSKRELSSKDWAALKRKNVETSFVSHEAISAHLAFYQNTDDRDDALMSNLLSALNDKQSAQRYKSAILVTGGFHVIQLAEKFKAANISYVLIRPTINSLPNEDFYAKQMAGDVSWKGDYVMRKGRVNIHDAFMRNVRDRLIGKMSFPRKRESQIPTFVGMTERAHQKAILKTWRDEIIRDLAQKDNLSKHHQYTKFLVELTDENKTPHKWQKKVEAFISQLKHLESKAQLTEPNILKLFQPATILSGVAHIFQPNGTLSANALGYGDVGTRVPGIREQSVNSRVPVRDSRKELRSKEGLSETEWSTLGKHAQPLLTLLGTKNFGLHVEDISPGRVLLRFTTPDGENGNEPIVRNVEISRKAPQYVLFSDNIKTSLSGTNSLSADFLKKVEREFISFERHVAFEENMQNMEKELVVKYMDGRREKIQEDLDRIRKASNSREVEAVLFAEKGILESRARKSLEEFSAKKEVSHLKGIRKQTIRETIDTLKVDFKGAASLTSMDRDNAQRQAREAAILISVIFHLLLSQDEADLMLHYVPHSMKHTLNVRNRTAESFRVSPKTTHLAEERFGDIGPLLIIFDAWVHDLGYGVLTEAMERANVIGKNYDEDYNAGKGYHTTLGVAIANANLGAKSNPFTLMDLISRTFGLRVGDVRDVERAIRLHGADKPEFAFDGLRGSGHLAYHEVTRATDIANYVIRANDNADSQGNQRLYPHHTNPFFLSFLKLLHSRRGDRVKIQELKGDFLAAQNVYEEAYAIYLVLTGEEATEDAARGAAHDHFNNIEKNIHGFTEDAYFHFAGMAKEITVSEDPDTGKLVYDVELYHGLPRRVAYFQARRMEEAAKSMKDDAPIIRIHNPKDPIPGVQEAVQEAIDLLQPEIFKDSQAVVLHQLIEQIKVDPDFFRPHTFYRGDKIIRQGTAGDTVYIIYDGKAAVRIDSQVVKELERGRIFGEMSLIFGQTTADVIAATDEVKTLAIPIGKFKKLLEDPYFLIHYAFQVAERDQENKDRKEIERLLEGAKVGRNIKILTRPDKKIDLPGHATVILLKEYGVIITQSGIFFINDKTQNGRRKEFQIGKKKLPAHFIQMKARGEPITVLTAYTERDAKLVGDMDMVLFGDSYAQVVLGLPRTRDVTMEQTLDGFRVVRKANPEAFLIGDMPHVAYKDDMSETEFQFNAEKAIRNARAFMDLGADAVKLEGGEEAARLVKALVDEGIPVMGHIGYLPQHHKSRRRRGKNSDEAMQLMHDALALQEAGAFSVVLEAIDQDVAQVISKGLIVPTIGIGAGAYTDGQVLVLYDLLGITDFSNEIQFPRGKPSFVGDWPQRESGESDEIYFPRVTKAYKDRVKIKKNHPNANDPKAAVYDHSKLLSDLWRSVTQKRSRKELRNLDASGLGESANKSAVWASILRYAREKDLRMTMEELGERMKESASPTEETSLPGISSVRLHNSFLPYQSFVIFPLKLLNQSDPMYAELFNILSRNELLRAADPSEAGDLKDQKFQFESDEIVILPLKLGNQHKRSVIFLEHVTDILFFSGDTKFQDRLYVRNEGKDYLMRLKMPDDPVEIKSDVAHLELENVDYSEGDFLGPSDMHGATKRSLLFDLKKGGQRIYLSALVYNRDVFPFSSSVIGLDVSVWKKIVRSHLIFFNKLRREGYSLDLTAIGPDTIEVQIQIAHGDSIVRQISAFDPEFVRFSQKIDRDIGYMDHTMGIVTGRSVGGVRRDIRKSFQEFAQYLSAPIDSMTQGRMQDQGHLINTRKELRASKTKANAAAHTELRSKGNGKKRKRNGTGRRASQITAEKREPTLEEKKRWVRAGMEFLQYDVMEWDGKYRVPREVAFNWLRVLNELKNNFPQIVNDAQIRKIGLEFSRRQVNSHKIQFQNQRPFLIAEVITRIQVPQYMVFELVEGAPDSLDDVYQRMYHPEDPNQLLLLSAQAIVDIFNQAGQVNRVSVINFLNALLHLKSKPAVAGLISVGKIKSTEVLEKDRKTFPKKFAVALPAEVSKAYSILAQYTLLANNLYLHKTFIERTDEDVLRELEIYKGRVEQELLKLSSDPNHNQKNLVGYVSYALFNYLELAKAFETRPILHKLLLDSAIYLHTKYKHLDLEIQSRAVDILLEMLPALEQAIVGFDGQGYFELLSEQESWVRNFWKAHPELETHDVGSIVVETLEKASLVTGEASQIRQLIQEVEHSLENLNAFNQNRSIEILLRIMDPNLESNPTEVIELLKEPKEELDLLGEHILRGLGELKKQIDGYEINLIDAIDSEKPVQAMRASYQGLKHQVELKVLERMAKLEHQLSGQSRNAYHLLLRPWEQAVMDNALVNDPYWDESGDGYQKLFKGISSVYDALLDVVTEDSAFTKHAELRSSKNNISVVPGDAYEYLVQLKSEKESVAEVVDAIVGEHTDKNPDQIISVAQYVHSEVKMIGVPSFADVLLSEVDRRIEEDGSMTSLISIGTVKRMSDHLMNTLRRAELRQGFQIGYLTSENESAHSVQDLARAMLNHQESLETVIVSGAGAKAFDSIRQELRDSNIRLATIGNLNRMSDVSLTQGVLPILKQASQSLPMQPYFVGVEMDTEADDPMLGMIHSELRVVTALLLASHVTSGTELRDPEFRANLTATLLKDLFPDSLPGMNLISFQSENRLIFHSVVLQAYLQHRQRQAFSQAA